MALTKGQRKVTLPIAGDVARYGRESVGENPLNTFGGIAKAIGEQIQNNQVKDFEIQQSSHKYILDNIAAQDKKDKAIEKAGQEADAARAKAQFDNAVALSQSRIGIDIDNALLNIELNHKNPTDYISNIQSWVTGYVKDNDLQTFKDSDGKIIFNPKQYIIETVGSKSNGVYKKLYNDQVNKNAENALNVHITGFESTLGTGLSNVSSFVENLNTESAETFLQDIELAYKPIYDGYQKFIGNLKTLQDTYPNIYGNNVNPDFIVEQTKKYRQLITEQTLGQVSKIYLDASSYNNLERSKLEAEKFIQDWYNNKFSDDSDLISERLVHNFTTNSNDFDLDTKENIVTKAEELLNDRYQLLSQELNLQYAGEKSQINLQRKNIENGVKDVLVGNINSEFIESTFTNYSKGKAPAPDYTAINNHIYTQTVKNNLVEDYKKLFDPNETKDFLSIKTDPQYLEIYTEQEIINNLYRVLNQEEINVEDVINKVNQATVQGFDISSDQTLSALSVGLEISKQYPTSFVNYAKNLQQENFDDKSSQDKLYNFLSTLKTLNNFEEFNLDSTFVEAAKYSFNFVNKPNPDETDVIKMAKSFERYFAKSKDSIDDIQSVMMETGMQFVPNHLVNLDKNILDTMLQNVWPWQSKFYPTSEFDISPSDLGEESTLVQSVKPNIFGQKGGNLKDSLMANQTLLSSLIVTEATRLASERDISYLGNNPNTIELREQILMTASKNVFNELKNDGWSFDYMMYNPDDAQGNYPVLSPYSILQHGNIKSIDDLRIETNHQLRMIFNAMSPAEKIDFFEKDNWQESIDNIDSMFDNGQIKFKIDDRSVLSGELRWFIMMDKEGQGANWEELEVINPNGEKVSWSPNNSVNPSSRASQDYVKSDMKNKIVNNLLTTFSPEFREEGVALAFDQKFYGLIADLSLLTMDNYKEFTDKFSKYKDFDTIKEIANNNQAEYAVEKQNVKNKIEIPNEQYVINEFAARIQQFDLPMSPQKNGEYFVYDSTYTDNNLNKKSFMAIGPNLFIEDPNVRKILLDNNYTNEDILKMTFGEMGINRDTYEQLGVYKYKTATSAYEEIYDEVVLTPRHRNVLIDIIASVGVDLVGPESNIYKYIEAGNIKMVYNEINKLKPYYNNTKRHTAHLRNWGIGG